MKKALAFTLFGCMLFYLAAAPGYSQSASDVLKKMIDASGGRKVLEGIKDTTMSGEMELTQMGMSGTLTIYHKEPNMVRQDMEIMGMLITSAFDGESGWMINPQTGSTEELPAEQQEYAKRNALEMGNAILLHPEKFGITFEFKGKEKVDDVDCLVLVQKHEDGHTTTMYIDAKTNLLYKSKQLSLDQMGGEVEQEMVFSDYKKISGVVAPHSMVIFQDGEEFGSVTITEMKINSGLEDALFKKE